MPARQVEPLDQLLDDLGAQLLGMSPAELRAFVESLHDPADVDLVERAIGRVADVGVRSDPASLMNHLTDGEYKLWAYVRLISQRIAEAKRGTRSRFQAINIPSQYGKTTLIGNVTPIWLLDQDPTLRVGYITYDSNKAVEEGGKARDLAERHRSRLNFELRADRRARGMWATPQGGGLYCVGLDGGITGWPMDVVLMDDLIKGWQAAHSEAHRKHVLNVYRSQIRMRSQGQSTIFIAGGTRWHESDIFAEFARMGRENVDADQWEFLRLPALAERANPDDADPMLREPDPLGRAPGEVLEPERFDEAEVRAKHAVIGSYLVSAIEQQRPAPEEGGEIRRSWWSSTTNMPPKFDDVASSWDMKLKDKETADYCVGQVWGRIGAKFYLLDQLRGQYSQAVARVGVALLLVRHPMIRRHFIENAGYGPEVMDGLRQPSPTYTLSDEMADELGILPDERPKVQRAIRRGIGGIVGVTPRGPKAVRLRAVSGRIEAGDVVLPEGKDFAAVVIGEAAAFPNGTTDDTLDALSQAISRMSKGSGTVAAPTGSVPKSKPTRTATGVAKSIGRRR